MIYRSERRGFTLIKSSRHPELDSGSRCCNKERFQIKFGMTLCNNNAAFTLIELLVVVLIIGILAAVAVPQYKMAVVKSKAVQLQVLFEAVVKASNLYYLHNGVYPKKFSDLDIDIDLPSGTHTCLGDLVASDVKQGDDFQISLYGGSGDFNVNAIAAYFTTGKYKCRGFGQVQYWKGTNDWSLNKSYCMEAHYNLACGTNCDNGIFCHNIMGKHYVGGMAGLQMHAYE